MNQMRERIVPGPTPGFLFENMNREETEKAEEAKKAQKKEQEEIEEQAREKSSTSQPN